MTQQKTKTKLAVWKLTSCDGCQLSLLDCEDELLAVADAVTIAYFPEATSVADPGPYDISIIEGSVSTPEHLAYAQKIRHDSQVVITIGACAASGGIQALRNFSDVKSFIDVVYTEPKYIQTLAESTAVSDHIQVDFELRGCPINKYQLLEVINAFLNARRPSIPKYSVCMECKMRGAVCVMTAAGTPCLGPVTQAGCGAICPAYHRGCYGCFGPQDTPNVASLTHRWKELGAANHQIKAALQTYNANAPAFRRGGDTYEDENG